MNPSRCEREPQTLAAILRGDSNPDVAAHAQTCPVCSEVRLVTQLLQKETQLADHELHSLPDAGLIWRRAQARAREKAIAKATLPIRMMRTCATVLAVFAAPWLVSLFTHPPAWLHELGLNRFSWADQSLINWSWFNQAWTYKTWPDQAWTNHGWLGALTGTTLLGLSVTIICIAVGSWYMLREK
jgi:hypothetical protein